MRLQGIVLMAWHWDMLPPPSPHDIFNAPWMKTTILRDSVVGNALEFKSSYLENFFLREFCTAISSASQILSLGHRTTHIPTPLSHAIPHVFFVLSQEQVGGVHAWRVVTNMTNTHPFRYWSVSEEIGKSVGSPNFTTLIAKTPISFSTASFGSFGTFPKPAPTFGFFYESPKTNFGWDNWFSPLSHLM